MSTKPQLDSRSMEDSFILVSEEFVESTIERRNDCIQIGLEARFDWHTCILGDHGAFGRMIDTRQSQPFEQVICDT